MHFVFFTCCQRGDGVGVQRRRSGSRVGESRMKGRRRTERRNKGTGKRKG